MLEDCEDETLLAYKNDSRIPCRYGEKCYQKNPLHLDKYKHPPKKKNKTVIQESLTGKKRKIEEIVGDKETSGATSFQSKIQKVDADIPITNIDETKCIPDNEEKDDIHLDLTSNDKKMTENTKQKITEESFIIHNNSNSIDNDSCTISSTNSMEQNIENLFLVKMPEDFYQFYEFCKFISKDYPLKALKSVHLYLVGPYDILNGKIENFTKLDKEKYLRHWRYYYDPPEFQTIIRGDKNGLHFGYWRDHINEKPIFVAKNKADINCIIEPVAENIFGAINNYIEDALKQANLFEKPSILQLQRRLKEFAQKQNITLQIKTDNMRNREKNVVARTFHKAGIVVPYNKKTQLGYRELAVTDRELQKILKEINEAGSSEERNKAMSKLDEIVRLATIAADECDFGTCLELAHHLFSSGSIYVEKIALQMFSTAYTHLDRLGFLEIAKAHLKDRKRGTDLSII